MEKLDKKDRRILYELDLNSRASFSRIAKRVGLSKETVGYRIKRLSESGVIKRFHTVISPNKLGLTSYRLLLKFRGVTSKEESEIQDYFIGRKEAQAVWKAGGAWDLFVWFVFEDISKFRDIWEVFFKDYGRFVQKTKLSIFTGVTYFHRHHLIGKEPQKIEGDRFITLDRKAEMDELDISLLRMLAKDARVPLTHLAMKTNRTIKTVKARIKELEKNGVIVSYRTLFDLSLLGIKHYKIHFSLQNFDASTLSRLRAYAAGHSNAIYYNEVLGGWDLELEVEVRGKKELERLLQELRNHFGAYITQYEIFEYETLKFLFFPLPHTPTRRLPYKY